MIITKGKIDGVYLLKQEKFVDERGSFARQFCKNELKKYGIDFDIKQCNVSENYKKGVLRGMHYQKEPYPETKIVSCFRGTVYDVVLDLRKDSPTYLKWDSLELSGENGCSIYIPSGVAHGFQTLTENTLIYYQLSEFFMKEYYSGVRWNDPKFKIDWPKCDNRIINERDSAYELFE